MSDIILVRHGQANTAATDEESYDRLSDLGHQQSQWLGAYLRMSGQDYTSIHCGTLRRHRETVAGMGLDAVEDARLNEMRYFDMAHALQAQTGQSLPQGPEGFANHVPKVFDAWARGDFDHVHTPYERFGSQIEDALREAATDGGRHLFITSGGVIGMLIARTLGLNAQGHAQVMLPVRNTSVHRFRIDGNTVHLSGYNATPHLDAADRAHARTTV